MSLLGKLCTILVYFIFGFIGFTYIGYGGLLENPTSGSVIHFTFFVCVFTLGIIAHLRSVFTDPGYVPNTFVKLDEKKLPTKYLFSDSSDGEAKKSDDERIPDTIGKFEITEENEKRNANT
jgi:hypothetical protein